MPWRENYMNSAVQSTVRRSSSPWWANRIGNKTWDDNDVLLKFHVRVLNYLWRYLCTRCIWKINMCCIVIGCICLRVVLDWRRTMIIYASVIEVGRYIVWQINTFSTFQITLVNDDLEDLTTVKNKNNLGKIHPTPNISLFWGTHNK